MEDDHSHPLDPLTVLEVKRASDCCKTFFAARFPGVGQLRFNTVTLEEPKKDDLLRYEKSPCKETRPPRMALCILQPPYKMFTEREEPYIVEAVVQLRPQPTAVLLWRQVTSVQPLLSPDDCFEAERLAKADLKVQELLASRYGITNPETEVACDPWSVHEHGSMKGRLCQLFMYKRLNPDDNHYSHPLDMVVVVDLNDGSVVDITAPEPAAAVNLESNDYHRNLMGKGAYRTPPKPLDIVQPQGPSFEVMGNLVKWQKWSFRVGWNYREGLVLHQVGYEDGGRVRPILHRASLVEMAVPYAEPRSPYHRKCAFDVGDYGLGNCANSLELGCDCLGHIHYFDATLNNSKGEPVTLSKAICMHEEDYGLLWKHLDYRSGHVESRRSRRLVVSFIATVVNYEYLFYWYLYQDGTIQYEIKLSGELSTNSLSPGEADPEYGTLVDAVVNAQHHQHMFCARLDFAVDDVEGGKGLEVVEQEVVPVEPGGPSNPFGNAFKVTEHVFEDEKSAQREVCPDKARTWVVRNPSVLNRFGRPVGYKLQTVAGPRLLGTSDGLIARKGAFATKNLWVTPFSDTERWPAGDYTILSPGGKGLPEWTAKNRAVRGADVVVWHAFGVTHIVRPEDFPVMPVEHVGFTLKPVGFFDRNPGVDLPPQQNEASKYCSGGVVDGGDDKTGAEEEGVEVEKSGCCGASHCHTKEVTPAAEVGHEEGSTLATN